MRILVLAAAVAFLTSAVGCGSSRPATGSDAGCGSCHGFPPATLTAGGAHPQPASGEWAATDCAPCHVTSVNAATGEVIPEPAGTHADGTVDGRHVIPYPAALHGPAADAGLATCQACHGAALDAVGGTATTSCFICHTGGLAFTNCTFCHGTFNATYTAANLAEAAPPEDVGGATATTEVTVGAHQAHVTATVASPLDCSACHGTLPTDIFTPGHLDASPAEVPFGAVASTGGRAPSWNRAAGTCSSTWCHDHGGSLPAPTWTVAGGLGCGSCHKDSNLTEPFHTRVSAAATAKPVCSDCHGSFDTAVHVNGVADIPNVNCTSCHGAFSATPTLRGAAPPVDTLGASTGAKVGAHVAHLDGKSYSAGFACASCHPDVATYALVHADGVAQVAFGSAPGGTGTFAGGTCSSTYCHGATLTGRAGGDPTWTGAVACDSCHGISPSTGQHGTHAGVSCGSCHTGYTSTTVDTALHVNGTVDARAINTCHCSPW